MIAQKLAQLNESTNRWRYQRSREIVVPESRGILSQRKSALLKKHVLYTLYSPSWLTNFRKKDLFYLIRFTNRS
ncbi:unnamed protein product [Acanthocheilonema viteae]|uniref:Uncharacterized protein n=1 Tax=Acanthocheilonema viteae TaxID=6277 RepID=A0A498SNM6_ACAVI|nr:unnamed protein product [Acanthocheilonema viteae]